MNDATSLYRPNIGVMVINEAGKVLLGRRDDPVTKPWQMVQGGIDKNEKAIVAGLRELEEEMGINEDQIEVLDLWDDFQYYDLPPQLKKIDDEFVGQKQKWLVVKFLNKDKSINLKNATDNEFTEYQWVKMDKAIDLIWQPKQKIYKALKKRYKHLLAD